MRDGIGHIERIDAVLATLEAVHRQCKDRSLEGLILTALYTAETLQDSLLEEEWSGKAARRPEACKLAEQEKTPQPCGDCLDGDVAELCFPV